ncbi:MBL fold metallo-hydrolase [Bacillus salitolerans]|uniref:MBL fold metallo-hydrolase n=1 Tax=Bacillus salitolerans TaxID=1437434 RepID=A0ABW4LPZ4_9BACI
MTKDIIETEYFLLHTLSTGIYAAIAKDGVGAWSNAGFIDLGNELLVFDAFSTPKAALELRVLAERVTNKEVMYVINSHYHGDHVFGNQVFKDCIIISTSLTRQLSKEQNVLHSIEQEQDEMKKYLQTLERDIMRSTDPNITISLQNQYMEMNKVLESIPNLEMVLPSFTFEKHLMIHGSMRSVELHCYGGGHTPSDSFLYIPNEKIAFMGDLVTECLHLPIHHPEDFLYILNQVRQMDIDIVIPGHGGISTLDSCTTLMNYITHIIHSVKEAHLLDQSVEELMSSYTTLKEYSSWRGVNGINRNLMTVYNFYKKKPANKQV